MDILEYDVGKREDFGHHPWEYARADIVERFIKKYAIDNKNLNVLDIGCGDAFTLKQLAKRFPFWTHYGIDTALERNLLDKILVENGKKHNIRLFSDYDCLENNITSSDCILLLDVLEHIEDDVDFLHELNKKTVVAKESLFVITVPAFQSLWTIRDQWLGHHRRYTLGELKRRVRAGGLKIVDEGYLFFSLLPLRLLQFIIEKVHKPKMSDLKGIGAWNERRLIGGLFEKIMIADFHLTQLIKKIGIKIPGLSCYIICRRC